MKYNWLKLGKHTFDLNEVAHFLERPEGVDVTLRSGYQISADWSGLFAEQDVHSQFEVMRHLLLTDTRLR